MIRRLLMAPGLALVMLAAAPSGVEASCAGPASLPDQIQAAALVFVGTVVYTSDDSRIAYVRVESIWKGPRLAQNVKVFGSPVAGANTATSVDRRYQAGTRYLLFDEKRDGCEEKPACQHRVEEQQKAGDEAAKSRFEVLLDRGRVQRQFPPKRPGFTT